MAADTEAKWFPEDSLGETNIRWKDFVTEYGEEYLGPELISHLENFYYKASDPNDKKQCVRLLAALTLGKEVQKKERQLRDQEKAKKIHRPKTAMPSLGHRRKPPVETHYWQEYPGIDVTKHLRYPEQRPSTTKNSYTARRELRSSLGTPHYSEEYSNKPYSMREPIRSGTSSGNRRNNPHPFESFMVWKFPKHIPEDHKEYPFPLTDSMLEQICHDKFKSTYQDDYLGLPQGYTVKSAYSGYEDWREKIPYTLDSTTRYTYQAPRQPKELQENSSRFGCNTKRHLVATGIVPHAPSRSHLVTIRNRTTYDREFGRILPPGTVQIERALESGQIESYLKNANEKEKDVITRMLHSIATADERCKMPSPPPRPGSASPLKERPLSPSWVSCWTGPM
ncbi:testis-expressed protein 26-like [Ptychodera flava]|uniref:testis-expressed protein 26-like n=1 Tax=Ptychodera flava TaxID=63121 RepID=UPI00396A9207